MKLPTTLSEKVMMNSLMEPEPRRRAAPRPVNLLQGEDFRCALYGSLGFSTHFIMRHTKLTPARKK